jgi:hypothetical protein
MTRSWRPWSTSRSSPRVADRVPEERHTDVQNSSDDDTNCGACDHTRPRDHVETPRRGAPFVVAHSAVPAPSGRGGHRLTWRIPDLFVGCASLALAASILAAGARAIAPFAHVSWLIAYLFLVGFLAQLLLGRGQAAMLAASPTGAIAPRIGAQATLWNVGVVAVPLGVLVGARLFVVLGSLALLTSLAAFWRGPPPRRALSGALELGYRTLIVFMAGSVFVGTALAWNTPWL